MKKFTKFLLQSIGSKKNTPRTCRKSRWSTSVLRSNNVFYYFDSYKEGKNGFLTYLTKAVKRDTSDFSIVYYEEIPILAHGNKNFYVLSTMSDESFENFPEEEKEGIKSSIHSLIDNEYNFEKEKLKEKAKAILPEFIKFRDDFKNRDLIGLENEIKTLESYNKSYNTNIERIEKMEEGAEELSNIASEAYEKIRNSDLSENIRNPSLNLYFNNDTIRISLNRPLRSIKDYYLPQKRLHLERIQSNQRRIESYKEKIKKINKEGSEKGYKELKEDYFIGEGVTCMSFSRDSSSSATMKFFVDGRTIKYDSKEWIIPESILTLSIRFTSSGSVRYSHLFSNIYGETGNFTHPHIRNGRPCWGNVGQEIDRCLKVLDMRNYMYHISAYMDSYNDQDPYVNIRSGAFKYVGQEEEERKAREKAKEEERKRREELEKNAEEIAARNIDGTYYDPGCDCRDCREVELVREARNILAEREQQN